MVPVDLPGLGYQVECGDMMMLLAESRISVKIHGGGGVQVQRVPVLCTHGTCTLKLKSIRSNTIPVFVI